MNLINLSDGESDGFGLMYVKNGVVFPVALNQVQAELLDVSLNLVFGESNARIIDTPLGKAQKLGK